MGIKRSTGLHFQLFDQGTVNNKQEIAYSFLPVKFQRMLF